MWADGEVSPFFAERRLHFLRRLVEVAGELDLLVAERRDLRQRAVEVLRHRVAHGVAACQAARCVRCCARSVPRRLQSSQHRLRRGRGMNDDSGAWGPLRSIHRSNRRETKCSSWHAQLDRARPRKPGSWLGAGSWKRGAGSRKLCVMVPSREAET